MGQPQVVIVTGGGRGIGAATAKKAAARGFSVCLTYHSDRVSAEGVANQIGELGCRAIAIQGDSSVESDVRRVIAVCSRTLGPPTLLVNNAGIVGRLGDLCDLDEATLRRVIDVNIIGYVLFAREVIRGLKARGESGAIVNVSSRAAVLGAPHEWIHYALTKGAIDTFTVGLAREVAELGIRVNAVRPGLIDTSIHASAGRPDRLSELARTVPMGRGGEAEEVADAILYLLSESASYVTGTCLDVAGGR